MIEPELLAKLNEIEAKVEQAYRSAESARKYLFWTAVVTAVLIILPAIGLLFAIPQFLNSYVGALPSTGF